MNDFNSVLLFAVFVFLLCLIFLIYMIKSLLKQLSQERAKKIVFYGDQIKQSNSDNSMAGKFSSKGDISIGNLSGIESSNLINVLLEKNERQTEKIDELRNQNRELQEELKGVKEINKELTEEGKYYYKEYMRIKNKINQLEDNEVKISLKKLMEN